MKQIPPGMRAQNFPPYIYINTIKHTVVILFSIQMTLEQCRELGVPTLRADKKPCITLQVVLCIHGSTSTDSTNRGFCNTVIFTIERNPLMSGPSQFKPVLFKGQPYS